MDPNNDFADFPAIGFVIATKLVAEDGQQVGFMYRETPMDRQDSGWRIFAGSESQDYVDVAENSGIYAPTSILLVDPSIKELLMEPVGSAFERNEFGDWMVAEGFEADGEETVLHDLGDGWQVELSVDFEGEEESDGALVFAAPNRTLRLAFYEFKDKPMEAIFAEHVQFIENRDESEYPTIERFQFSLEGQELLGFMVKERTDDREYFVLYGFTIAGNEVVQSAFYFDEEEDKDWALETWMEILKETEAEANGEY